MPVSKRTAQIITHNPAGARLQLIVVIRGTSLYTCNTERSNRYFFPHKIHTYLL